MANALAVFGTSLSVNTNLTLRNARAVGCEFSTQVDALSDITIVRIQKASAFFETGTSVKVSLSAIRSQKALAEFRSDMIGSAKLSGLGVKVESILRSSLAASVGITTPIKVQAELRSEMSAGADLTGASDLRGRTLCELIKESLSLWGFLCAKNAPQYALDRAITDVNTAMQLVWNNAEGKDYWSNETMTLTIANGQSVSVLPDSIQNVTGPLRRADNKRPLTPLRSIGELESFADLYLNGETADQPLAYHIARMKQTAEDPVKCVLNVVPAVSGASVSFLLEVIKECPRYTFGDLLKCPLIPIPHQYAETLLIPIIRYNASSYFLFSSSEASQKETIDREYKQAMISIGLADPNPVKSEEKDEPK